MTRPDTNETSSSKKAPAKQSKPDTAQSAQTEKSGARETGQRTREGVVLSNKMQKTVIVEVSRLIEHPQFKKIIRRRLKYAVHDEKNEAKIGDKVQIMETRPLSKTKRWRLVKVLAK